MLRPLHNTSHHLKKIAVVSDKDWVISAMEIFKYVIPGPVRTYSNEGLAEAKAWISEYIRIIFKLIGKLSFSIQPDISQRS